MDIARVFVLSSMKLFTRRSVLSSARGRAGVIHWQSARGHGPRRIFDILYGSRELVIKQERLAHPRRVSKRLREHIYNQPS